MSEPTNHPTHRGRSKLSSTNKISNPSWLKHKRYIRATEPQLAVITAIDENSGEITCKYITDSDGLQKTFKVPFSTSQVGLLGQHFFGGQYDIDDIVYVSTITTNDRASYRIITQSLSSNFQGNIYNGAFPLLKIGEKLVQSKGNAYTHWKSSGTISMVSGYQSPEELQLIDGRRASLIPSNPNLVLHKDHLTIWNDENAGQNTSLRTLHSNVAHTQVQWGFINRISEIDGKRIIERVSESESEFKVSIMDENRRQEKSILFLGFGYNQDGTLIRTPNTGTHAIGGFAFSNRENFSTQPGLLWNAFGGFDLTDGNENCIFTDDTHLVVNAAGSLVVTAETGMVINVNGLWNESCGNKVVTTRNYGLYVHNDFTEEISALHTVKRNDDYNDTASPKVQYLWKISSSPISEVLIAPTELRFGLESAITRISLTADSGKLGTDTIVAPLLYDAEQLKIGTGSTVDIIFNASSNTIKHSVLNVMDAPINRIGASATSNFFGTEAVTQPMVKGTSLTTFLAQFQAATTNLSTALDVLFKIPGWATIAAIDITGEVAAGITAASIAITTATGELSATAAQIAEVVSIKNFTE